MSGVTEIKIQALIEFSELMNKHSRTEFNNEGQTDFYLCLQFAARAAKETANSMREQENSQ